MKKLPLESNRKKHNKELNNKKLKNKKIKEFYKTNKNKLKISYLHKLLKQLIHK